MIKTNLQRLYLRKYYYILFKIVEIYCLMLKYNNIFAKMKFANILLNIKRRCDNIFLKGGNEEWKNYQH